MSHFIYFYVFESPPKKSPLGTKFSGKIEGWKLEGGKNASLFFFFFFSFLLVQLQSRRAIIGEPIDTQVTRYYVRAVASSRRPPANRWQYHKFYEHSDGIAASSASLTAAMIHLNVDRRWFDGIPCRSLPIRLCDSCKYAGSWLPVPVQTRLALFDSATRLNTHRYPIPLFRPSVRCFVPCLSVKFHWILSDFDASFGDSTPCLVISFQSSWSNCINYISIILRMIFIAI